MSISRHLSDETLAAFAAGSLDEGSTFVAAAHIAMCQSCREAVRDFECIGGALLGAAEPSRLGRDFDGASMQELAMEQPQRPDAAPSATDGSSLDRLLSLYGRGPWKWRGFGVHSADVQVPVQNDVRVFFLKAAPGTHMPRHSHTGVELTLVLQGAFSHAFGRFGPGDVEEADSDIDHRPVVERGEDCICLVAMSGRLQLQGIAGRLLQPFVRL